jgi:hypothetical protein
MDIVPGPVAYAEGEELRESISVLRERLSELQNRATTTWAETHRVEATTYRQEAQGTIAKALDLLRNMSELARWVGGDRARAL